MASIKRPSSRLLKKAPSYTGSVSEEDDPSLSAEDEEADETFVALQKLLKVLNRSNRNSRAEDLANEEDSNNLQPPPASERSSDSSLRSPEDMLQSRRQERDRTRRSLYGHNARRYTCLSYNCSEEEEEEEGVEPSVESTISNRFINGSFSSLNVHVISRDRWSTEENVCRPQPLVMLPKSGKPSFPTDNEKIKVVQTDEYIDLREKLVHNLPAGASTMQYLPPPRSTWYMQMHDFEQIKR